MDELFRNKEDSDKIKKINLEELYDKKKTYDLSKLSKIEDDNKSSISHKKYHSNNSKITATISNALKSINKNTEFKNEIIKIRDNRKDSLYPFINNKLKD